MIHRLLPLLSLLLAATIAASPTSKRPNVIIILTDDQGMGDLSLYGNPVVETPHLDRLAHEGVSFDQFHVTSMCSPTRAALLTGLPPIENGAISTCQGLGILRPEHPVVSESFAEAGYATGIFGKWHLGENWPSRPQDRGFQENVVLHGFGQTGIASRWNNDYIDTWVDYNGEEKQIEGFCTDAFFREAMNWMTRQQEANTPFFAYIPTNAPHFPFWAPEEWTEPYRDTLNPEFFAMVKNIDDNIGRLRDFLRESGLEQDTVLIFTSDNGPVGGTQTWNAGMTGGKANPWEGGHRVPLFIRYPAGGIEGGRVVEGLTDVIDLYPTLLDICGIEPPSDSDLSGVSLVSAMLGEADIPKRHLLMNIQQVELHHHRSAIMYDRWRLLFGSALYDIEEDLAQEHNIAALRPEIFTQLWQWFESYESPLREYATTAMHQVIGSPHQPEVRLDAGSWTIQRADGQKSVREATSRRHTNEGSHWNVQAYESGTYAISLARWPLESGLALDAPAPPFQTVCSGEPTPAGIALPIVQASLDIDGRRIVQIAEPGAQTIRFEVELESGQMELHGTFRDAAGNPLCGAFYAYIERI